MKWEYRTMLLTGTRHDIQVTLNEAGADGWEPVAVQGSTAYFKRAKAKEEEPAKKVAVVPAKRR
jgi:hypothetical protein